MEDNFWVGRSLGQFLGSQWGRTEIISTFGLLKRRRRLQLLLQQGEQWQQQELRQKLHEWREFPGFFAGQGYTFDGLLGPPAIGALSQLFGFGDSVPLPK